MKKSEFKCIDPIEITFEMECKIMGVKPEDRNCFRYKKEMTIEEIKKEYPDLYDKITKDALSK